MLVDFIWVLLKKQRFNLLKNCIKLPNKYILTNHPITFYIPCNHV